MLTSIIRYRAAIVIALLAAFVAALQWIIRDQPVIFGPLRFDALSLFFGFALLFAAWYAAADGYIRVTPRALALALAAAFALVARSTVMIALLYAVITLLSLPQFDVRWEKPWGAFVRGVLALPLILAAACLAISYGTLALRAALLYDDALAGSAIDSLVFWFTLLAAVLPFVTTTDERQQGDKETRRQGDKETSRSLYRSTAPTLYRSTALLLFLYPLVRLYTLGPWNSGWSLATALFGGGLALWAAWRFLVRRETHFARAALLALALACFGLSTSAGVASGCFLVLAAAVMDRRPTNGDRRPTTDDADFLEALLHSNAPTLQRSNAPTLQRSNAPTFQRSNAVLAAPLVAVWMTVGAAIAGGVSALAIVAWAVALLGALAVVLGSRWHISKARAAASCVVALGAPFVLLVLIEPVVLQLQGGLTPYGDVLIWPWIGLAFVNSAQAQVAVLPSIAIALLMIVLVALVYVLAQLRGVRVVAEPAAGNAGDFGWLWQALREEVPWLGERQRSDAE